VCIAQGPNQATTVFTRRRLDRGPLSIRFEPRGVSTSIAVERSHWACPGRTHGYQSDVHKLVWWMAHRSRARRSLFLTRLSIELLGAEQRQGARVGVGCAGLPSQIAHRGGALALR